jgi:hypothetical protein
MAVAIAEREAALQKLDEAEARRTPHAARRTPHTDGHSGIGSRGGRCRQLARASAHQRQSTRRTRP